MEWSLQRRSIENDILKSARELVGVGIVCYYSPLGRGLLSKTFTSVEDIDTTDWHKTDPNLQETNFDTNLPTTFFSIADWKGCTPAQLALLVGVASQARRALTSSLSQAPSWPAGRRRMLRQPRWCYVSL